ncbi:hypothetical protein LJC45_00515 [Alistipes sp. OttesenSCG-928-B03]|nr:hypothetical protein [Alistipes sp. OttesenSCG-928-B03]
MKTIQILKPVLVLVIAAGFFACAEDKGNYDYTKVNEVIISGIKDVEDPYMVELDKVLEIEPQIEFSLGEESPVTYEWVALGYETDQYKPGTIATSKDLKLPIKGMFGRLGEYDLVFRVTNTETEVVYSHFIKMEVTGQLAKGLIAISDIGGKAKVDMVAFFDGKLTFRNDLLALTGSTVPVDGTPIDIVTQTDKNSPTAGDASAYAVWILTDKHTNRVNPVDYSYQDMYSLRYALASYAYVPDQVADRIVQAGSSASYLYKDGYWLYYVATGTPYLWGATINVDRSVSPKKQFEAAPYGAFSSQYGVIFNEDDNSFMYHSVFMVSTDVGLSTTPITTGTKFMKPNTPFELKYMDNRRRLNTNAFAILKSTVDGKHYMGTFTFNMYGATEGDLYDISPAEDIATAISYAWHPTHNFLYFATEDAVYEVKTSVTPVTVKKVVDAKAAGEKVSMIKYLKITTTNTFGSATNASLAVCTYDPDGKVGSNGTVRMYNTDAIDGGLTIVKHNDEDMAWSGFGKIVGIDLKEK